MMRRGFRTSEFWLVAAVATALLAGSATDLIPAQYGSLGAGISAAAYAIARGMAKQAGADVLARVIGALTEEPEPDGDK